MSEQPPKAQITTTLKAPFIPPITYESSVSIPPGEQITTKGLISLITGHISTLNEELNVLKNIK